MTKVHFVRYSEPREQLEISPNSFWSFDAGTRQTQAASHRTKTGALAHIDGVNRAAGKIIAFYAGSAEKRGLPRF